MKVGPRECVIFADDYPALVAWYKGALGLSVKLESSGEYHYTQLVNDEGVDIGIAKASEMGIKPGDRSTNSVLLQFQVEDVKAFFEHLARQGAQALFGPSYDKKDAFWFGGFADPEGNPCWVVDRNCP